jgi:hypothetical protein
MSPRRKQWIGAEGKERSLMIGSFYLASISLGDTLVYKCKWQEHWHHVTHSAENLLRKGEHSLGHSTSTGDRSYCYIALTLYLLHCGSLRPTPLEV